MTIKNYEIEVPKYWKYSIGEYKIQPTEELLKLEGYLLLEKPKKYGRSYDCICPEGHFHKVHRERWLKGVRCPICAVNIEYGISRIKKHFEAEGYKVIDNEYVNPKALLNTVCPNGHAYRTSWHNWNRGYRCSSCYRRSKKSIPELKKIFEAEGYKLLSNEYFSNRQPLDTICPKGHTHKVSWNNWSKNNNRCRVCTQVGTLNQEKELFDFVYSIDNSAIRQIRDIIYPYELDIVIPDRRIAIEYCGLRWHSEKNGRVKRYHLKKFRRCEYAKYKLITIFEDEWLTKKDIVKSVLYNALSDNVEKIDNYKIMEIDNNVSSLFYRTNGLFNYIEDNNINLSMQINGDMVGTISIKSSSVDSYTTVELSNLSYIQQYDAGNILNIFIDYIKNNYDFNKMYLQMDKRLDIVKIYGNTDFTSYDDTPLINWFFEDNTKRYLKSELEKEKGYTKHKIIKTNRLWDCGGTRYILEKENR